MTQPVDYTYNAGAEAVWQADEDYDKATPPFGDYWNAGDGAWTDSGDWIASAASAGGPVTVHYVPGFDDSVELSTNSSTPYAITYSAIDQIWSLSSNPGVTLDITAGSLTVDHNSFNYAAIDVARGASLNASLGADLTFGGGVVQGELGGAGTITLGSGTTYLESGTDLASDDLVINSGNGTYTSYLTTSLSYGGVFDMFGQFDTIDLGGKNFVLTGASNVLSVGNIDDGGRFKVTGGATINGNLAVGYGTPASTIEDAGTMTQSGGLSLDGELVIDAGANFTFTSTTNINNGVGGDATTINNGTFTVADPLDGTSHIEGTFTTNKTLTVDADDTLDLVGGTDTLAGTIGGAGTLNLVSGAVAVNTTSVTVGDLTITGGDTTLGVALTYKGVFDLAGEFATLDLDGHALTLSGLSDAWGGGDINGAGTVTVSGALAISSNVSVAYGGGNAATIVDAGSLSESGGSLSLNGELVIDAGASYTFTGATNISNGNSGDATTINSGTLTDADSSEGSSHIYGAFANNKTLTVDTGDSLYLVGTDTLRGTLGGGGALYLGGTATIYAVTMTVGSLYLYNGSTTLEASLTYGGGFNLDGEFETLELNGKELLLTGASNTVSGGALDGAGRLKVTGDLAFTGPFFDGYQTTGAVIEDAGKITQSASIYLDDELLIDAHATYTFTQTASINSIDKGVTTINDGTLIDADALDGTSVIQGGFTNNSILTIDAGDTLDLSGTQALHGTINGAGDLEIGGTTTIGSATMTQGALMLDGGTTTLNSAFGFSGAFDLLNGNDTLALGKFTLTLKGSSNLGGGATVDGSGLFVTTHASTISGVTLGGTEQWENYGTASENGGNLTLGDSSGATAVFLNTLHGTYDITDDSDIRNGASNTSSYFSNSGLIEKTVDTGESSILASVANNGVMESSAGLLDLQGQVSGTGVDKVGAGATLEFDGAVATTQTVSYSGSGGVVSLQDLDASGVQLFHGAISGFAAGDTLDIGSFGAGTSAIFTENSQNTGGMLQLTDGALTASVGFLGDYSTANFGAPQTDGNGGSLIKFQ